VRQVEPAPNAQCGKRLQVSPDTGEVYAPMVTKNISGTPHRRLFNTRDAGRARRHRRFPVWCADRAPSPETHSSLLPELRLITLSACTPNSHLNRVPSRRRGVGPCRLRNAQFTVRCAHEGAGRSHRGLRVAQLHLDLGGSRRVLRRYIQRSISLKLSVVKASHVSTSPKNDATATRLPHSERQHLLT
jgi:hypothetical protein